jgi:hypothetical protein
VPAVVVERRRVPAVVVERRRVPAVVVERRRVPAVVVERRRVPVVVVERRRVEETLVQHRRFGEVPVAVKGLQLEYYSRGTLPRYPQLRYAVKNPSKKMHLLSKKGASSCLNL